MSASLKDKGLDEERIAEMQAAFSMFDKADTGQITVADLDSLYRSLGAHPAAAFARAHTRR